MILQAIAARRLDTLQAIPYGMAALVEFFVCFFPESARVALQQTQVDIDFSFILLAALLSCFRPRPQTQKPPARSVGRCNVAARFTTRGTCLIVKSTIKLEHQVYQEIDKILPITVRGPAQVL